VDNAHLSKPFSEAWVGNDLICLSQEFLKKGCRAPKGFRDWGATALGSLKDKEVATKANGAGEGVLEVSMLCNRLEDG